MFLHLFHPTSVTEIFRQLTTNPDLTFRVQLHVSLRNTHHNYSNLGWTFRYNSVTLLKSVLDSCRIIPMRLELYSFRPMTSGVSPSFYSRTQSRRSPLLLHYLISLQVYLRSPKQLSTLYLILPHYWHSQGLIHRLTYP